MKVSPEYLRRFLNERRKTYEFITLDILYELSMSGKELKKPFFVMTFDDGYRDNYEYALPVFEEMKIPFTVYVANSFPNKTAFLWWYVLEDILQKNRHIVLSDKRMGGVEFVTETKKEKEDVFLQLREIILKLDQEKLIENFTELFHGYVFDLTSYNERLCLSWDMVREMANSNYCTIASHTVNHKTLNQLSDADAEYEILDGKRILEEKTGKTIRHFAYPFGTSNEIGIREVEYVQKCGFDTACYSFGGDINKKTIHKLCELPRVFLGELYR